MEIRKKILVINGPNINMLGIREPEIYGSESYADLIEICQQAAEDCGCAVEVYQSNHEGDLIDKIQSARGSCCGIVINAGGYSHTSVAILDALRAVSLPAVTVHISDIEKREEFRRQDLMAFYADKKIAGKGLACYKEAIYYLAQK